jgi:hypothetical protein
MLGVDVSTDTNSRRLPSPASLEDDAAWTACLNSGWHERDFDFAEKIAKIMIVKSPEKVKLMTALLHIHQHTGEIDLWPPPRLAVILSPHDGRALLYKRWFTALRLYEKGDVEGAITVFRVIARVLRKEAPFAFGLNLRNHEESLALLRGGDTSSDNTWNPVEPISRDGRPFTILVSGNQEYMKRFGHGFLRSVAEKSPGANVHLHLCDPGTDPIDLLLQARSTFPELHVSASWSKRPDLPRPTYFACARFLIAPRILRQTGAPILVVDLDAVLRRDPTAFIAAFDGVDLGLAVSENSAHWNTVKANMVWAAPTEVGLRFMSGLANYLEVALTSSECVWTLDQTALWAARHHIEATCPGARLINLYRAQLQDGRCLNLFEEILAHTSESRARSIARARARRAPPPSHTL